LEEEMMPSLGCFSFSAPDYVSNSTSVFEFDEKERMYRPNEWLFAEGDPAFYAYKVVSGVVICFKSSAAGRRSIDAFRFAGDVFGYDGDRECQFSAAAISNVSVRVARRDVVFLRAVGDRDAGQELLAATYQELQRAQRHALLLSMNAHQRIASFLLVMWERLGQPDILELPMSRRDIADYLGLTIETVSRTITKLDRTCLVGLRTSRYVALLDVPALRLMADAG
jgi:CRP/FNR family transcriptional regulator, nitrogen fixation regulation protein